MGKSKKGRCGSEKEETLEDDDERGGGGFYGCYLLISLSPRHKGHTYIGFTVNPKRRIRQHNGEMRSGAWRTKSKRPWEMALLIYGFPTNVAALQFEWAWQHPIESLAVRKAAVTFKSLSGIANKIKLALTMLTLPAWGSLNLTVNFFSTKYKKHCAGCPSLPEHMKVQICSMDELPCYNNTLLFDEKNVCREDDEWDIESDDGQAAVDTNLAEHDGNSEGVEAGGDRKQVMETFHSSADCNHSRIEEATKEESSSKELKRDSQGDDALLLLPSKFPDTILFSSFATSSSSCIAEAVERGMFSLREEECIVEPARKDLPIRASADGDQPTLLRSPTVACDVEVIDLFTPSPSLQTKKRRTVFSEIIDLTKSPTFV